MSIGRFGIKLFSKTEDMPSRIIQQLAMPDMKEKYRARFLDRIREHGGHLVIDEALAKAKNESKTSTDPETRAILSRIIQDMQNAVDRTKMENELYVLTDGNHVLNYHQK